MNTDPTKIHFTSQTCIEFISFPIIYEYLTWLQTGAFTLLLKKYLENTIILYFSEKHK